MGDAKASRKAGSPAAARQPPRSRAAPAPARRGAGAGRGGARPSGEREAAASAGGSSSARGPRGAAGSARSCQEKESGSGTRGKGGAPRGRDSAQGVKEDAAGGKDSAQRGKGDAPRGKDSAQRGKGDAPRGKDSTQGAKGDPTGRKDSARRAKGDAPSAKDSAQGTKGDAPDGKDSAQRVKGDAPGGNDSAQGAKGDPTGRKDSARRGKGDAPSAKDSAQRAKGDTSGGNDSAQGAKGDPTGRKDSARRAKGDAPSAKDSAQGTKGDAPDGKDSAQRVKGDAPDGKDSAQGAKGDPTGRKDSARRAKGDAPSAKDSAQRAKGDAPDGKDSAKGDAPSGKDSAQRGKRVVCRSKESALKEPQPERCSGAQRGWLSTVLSTLVLPQQDIQEASARVNELIGRLVPLIQTQESAFRPMEKLNTGSYYEHVKIAAPDEFDIMLKIPTPRVELKECELKECEGSGAFFYVQFKRNPQKNDLDKFLSEEGILAACKMLSALRKIIKDFVNSTSGTEMKVTMDKKKPGSPAVTLRIGTLQREISVDIILALKVQKSWPASTEGGLKIEKWLGTKVKQEYKWEPIYLVPKHAKDVTGLKEDTWRLSFSHIEKDMIKKHGNAKTCCESEGVKCCRKDCLKLLKHLLARLKTKYGNRRGMDKFYSYHAKTAFFHACVHWPDDKQWPFTDLEGCFDKLLHYFMDFLNEAYLPHFFIPKYNLFCLIDKASTDFLSKEIKFEINNGFPIFQN